jgi:hypothetical protein
MPQYVVASGGTISSSNDILLIVAVLVAALLLLQITPVVFRHTKRFLLHKLPIFRKL